MSTYIIDRSEWVCALNTKKDPRLKDVARKHLGLSELLNDKNRMCCMGQICNQGGVSRLKLSGRGFPSGISYLPADLLWMAGIEDELAEDNDNENMTQDEREFFLTEQVAQAGHKLEFTGELLTLKQWRGEE